MYQYPPPVEVLMVNDWNHTICDQTFSLIEWIQIRCFEKLNIVKRFLPYFEFIKKVSKCWKIVKFVAKKRETSSSLILHDPDRHPVSLAKPKPTIVLSNERKNVSVPTSCRNSHEKWSKHTICDQRVSPIESLQKKGFEKLEVVKCLARKREFSSRISSLYNRQLEQLAKLHLISTPFTLISITSSISKKGIAYSQASTYTTTWQLVVAKLFPQYYDNLR